MTLTELRYIVAVARTRHFGRAAEACFVSQPTLSVAVRKLEEELGVVLFERSHNEVTLTPVGKRIVTQAQRVLEEAKTLGQIARAESEPLTTPLRLGAIFTIGPYLLPHLIPIMRQRAPRLPLLVEENYTANLSTKLKQGEVDAIVIALPFDVPGVETRPLYDEPFSVLLPASHRWGEREAIRVAELAEETVLLLGPGHCFRDQVLEACPGCQKPESGNDNIQRSLEGSSLETIRHMVAGGVGITVLPCTAAEDTQYSQELIRVRPFEGTPPSRRVALAWRKSYPHPEAIEVLYRAILDCPIGCVSKLAAD
jgi:LysR family hydrogen peroxide-inducible transcriptional activator